MTLSRRELLTLFLGAPFAFAACRETSAKRLPEGEIIGQSANIGHILREGRTFEVPQANWETKKVVIVGAGIAGLSAAWRLKSKGFEDVVVIELEKEAGGTSRSGVGKPVNYPWGAHYLPVPFAENADLVTLLDEMSLLEPRGPAGEIHAKEEFLCREPEERVFYKGRWYEGLYLNAGASQEDKRQYGQFYAEVNKWINFRDAKGRRAFVLPVAHCSDDAEVTALDKLSFADWLTQKGLNSERLQWYCDYACRDDYGLKLEETSAWAGLFYFCSRVKKSGDESQPFITVPEGNGQFVNHFIARVGDKVRKDWMAVAIEPKENGVEVTCLVDGTLRGIKAEKVVFAGPMFTAPYAIRGFREAPPFDASEFQHNAWFVANLHLKDRPVQRFRTDFPLAWDNVLYESPSLGYVTATHQKGIDYGPTTLTYYYPMCAEQNARTKLFDYDRDQIAEVCLSDMERAHKDIRELTTRLDVMRWGHAMISPRPNFIWSGVRQKAMEPYRSIHFAHTDIGGVALFEEAFYHGLRVADKILSN